MGKLRAIFIDFWAKAQEANNIHDYEAVEKRIVELCLAVIGSNEPYGDAPTNGDKIIRNNLRDELREKVKGL
jgi:hypothetical protein